MKKIISVLLISLVFLLPFSVFAQNETWEYTQEGTKVEFTLNGNTTSYEKFYRKPDEVVVPKIVDEYEIEEWEYVQIPSGTKEYIFKENESDTAYFSDIYATEQGKENLLELREGKYYHFALADYDNYYLNSDIEKSILDELENIDAEPYLINAFVLKDAQKTIYEILGFEKNRCVAKRIGAIYFLNSGVYYLRLQDSSQCEIDEEGAICYASDEIALIEITGELKNKIKLCVDSVKYNCTGGIHLLDSDFSGEVFTDTKVAFYITSILFSIIVPGALLVLGVVLAQSKKSLHPKKWYVISITSALWIIVNVVLMCIAA